MSWTFKVKVKDGKAELAAAPYYAPPDGEYVVNGHEDQSVESITVTRFKDSIVVVQAMAHHKKTVQ